MIMAGVRWMGAAVLLAALAVPASAQELSEKSVRVFMEYAWSMLPQQYSKVDGTLIVVDKTKRAEVLVPLDIARETIRVGRISAHAQICNLPEDQANNYRSMMRRETGKKKWTDQQTLYISQLHLTTVMLLTGKIKLVGADGDKEVVVEEKQTKVQTCSDEQRKQVKDLIAAYVKAGPSIASYDIPAQSPAPAKAAPAAAAAAPPAAK
jgi:hypothetical protein